MGRLTLEQSADVAERRHIRVQILALQQRVAAVERELRSRVEPGERIYPLMTSDTVRAAVSTWMNSVDVAAADLHPRPDAEHRAIRAAIAVVLHEDLGVSVDSVARIFRMTPRGVRAMLNRADDTRSPLFRCARESLARWCTNWFGLDEPDRV